VSVYSSQVESDGVEGTSGGLDENEMVEVKEERVQCDYFQYRGIRFTVITNTTIF
jgi:hypothetical protein